MSNKPARKKTGSANSLRIIGGTWRGRKLQFPSAEGLRPTPDRVRETLFNWLAPHITDAHCLDLFSGSGALGFEALSRGAASATLLDRLSQACSQLGTNCGILRANEQTTIINHDVLAWLEQPATQTFDIVFLDPPYHQGLIGPCAALLNDNGYLHSGSLVYMETASDEDLPALPDSWVTHREKQAGQVRYALYRAGDCY
jgi:16S rRNA (guanine966-N2)-methyltransferase